MGTIRLALNADTTPLSVSDTLVFKPLRERAREAFEAGFPATNVDEEDGLTPEGARRIVGEYGLEIASGFFHAPFYDASAEDAIMEAAARKRDFAAALGQDCIFVSAWVSPPERHAIAGRVRAGEEVALDDRQFEQLTGMLERTARLWGERGITLCYHPHVATYIEAPHEIERLFAMTDADLVRLGPDTGHLYYGGVAPVAFIEHHLMRVAAIHLKDVRPDVVAEARREKLDYRQAAGRGLWTELGTGGIDFPALFKMLEKRGWSGWVIVETDHTRLPTALDSSRLSRCYLSDVIGI